MSRKLTKGIELIDHVTEIGKRRPIAGVEKSLPGIKAKGYREVLVSPHLAYGVEGTPNSMPANAMLRVELWVWNVASPN